ncbi:MAG TPA: hypothetical protein VJQ44_09870 [Gemmatimonadales bacterium]|nr:hypothetical protein [Gemmatimonadales bacterium]
MSSTASVTILLALAAAPLIGGPGKAGHLPPLTARYRIDQTLNQEIDASGAGAGRQVIHFTTTSFITVRLTDSAGGKSVRVVLDSMRGDSAAPIPTSVMDSARGGEFRSYLDRSGRPAKLVAAGNPAAAQVQGLLSDFLPWIRAGFKVGESWADTAVASTGEGADTVTIRRIVTYRATGNETQGARKAVRIATTHASEVSGSQPTPQGPAKISGTGKGSGSYLVSSDGRYLGGEWEITSALQLSGQFSPQPVPITITQSTKVAILP